MKDQTLILIKPDAIKKGLIGAILKRFEDSGFRIIKLKMMRLSEEDAKKFYSIHTKKPFFNNLIPFITSSSVVAAIIEGEEVRAITRKIIGTTNPKKAPPGTIRGDFGTSITENAIHASDSYDSFLKEYKVIFRSQD